MAIDVSPEIEMRLKEAFQQAIAERLASLDAGELVDGEEVMSRLTDVDVHRNH